MTDWHFESVRVLARRIRRRELSSVELVDAFLDRIAEHNPALNAVVSLDPGRARAEAKRADERLSAGAHGRLGPLHGVPMTIKDGYEVAGMRSTAGAKPWAEHVPAQDALAVQRLRDAGAIVLGKTNTPAFCSDFQTYNTLFGTTHNPWDLTRTPGGSSGGAAAALAAGLTPIELGSDIAGSIRLPAAFCGVLGHKSSYDLVPTRGHIPGPPGTLARGDLVVAGPMAREADDLAYLLPILAGPTPEVAKAYRLALPAPRATTLRGYRVAAWLDDPAFPLDDSVAQPLHDALDALRKAGVTVDAVHPDFGLAEAHAVYSRLFDPITVVGLPDKVITQLEAAAASGETNALTRMARNALARHTDWLVAHEQRERLRAKLARFFEDYDVLLCPVAITAAFAHDQAQPQFARTLMVNGERRPYHDLMGWLTFVTATYSPATVAPIGRTRAGLPVGMQIVGPYLEDLTTIDFAGRLGELVGGFEAPPGY